LSVLAIRYELSENPILDEPSCIGYVGNVLFRWDYWTDKIAPAESSRAFLRQNETGGLSL
jgi:hypothetical protein